MVSTIQSILFPKTKYTLKSALEWLMRNHFKYIKVDETQHHYRFRQTSPSGFKRFRTKRLPDGVEFIIAFK